MNTAIKKILITVSEGSIARNILRSFLLRELAKDENILIYLLVPPQKADFYEDQFASARIKILPAPPLKITSLGKLLNFLARNIIYSETVLIAQKRYLLNGGSHPAFFVKRFISTTLGRFKIFHNFIRFLSGLRKPDQKFVDLLKINPIQLIFSTDVQEEMDFAVVNTARRLKIKTVGMIRSWDNLSSRFVLFVPDILAVWNPYIHKLAVNMQHIPARIVKIVGVPQYDWFSKKEVLLSRDNFLKSLGIFSDAKIILYAGIGTHLAPHEAEVAEILDHAITYGKIKDKVRIIFRPHPGFPADKEEISSLQNIIFDSSVFIRSCPDDMDWEKDDGAMAHLVNSLYHADLILTTASTMTIDAVVFDKPVVCIAFDGYQRDPVTSYLIQSHYEQRHYKDLAKTGGFKVARNPEELVNYINEYLGNPGLDREGRKKIFEEFIWRLDGKSSERLSWVIKDALRPKS